MALITKDDIINGKDNLQKHTIHSLGGEVYLRPLTRGEATEIEQIQAKSMGKYKTRARGRNTESDGVFDVSSTTKAQRESQLKAVYYSINNSKMGEWSEDDLDTLLTKEQFDEIFMIVENISGLNDDRIESQVENFPENK